MSIHKTLTVALSAGLLAVAPSLAQYGQSGSQDKDKDKDKQQQTTSSPDRDRDRDENRSANAAGQLTSAERKFLTGAAQGSLAEIELGKLAQERGSSDQVKDLGKKLVDDHQKALDKAKEIAQKNNVTLPDQPTSKQKSVQERLSKLSGAEFDRAFAREISREHKKDVSEFEKMSQRASNNDVKEFASETVEKLKEHQQLAMSIAGSSTTADGNGSKKREMKPDEGSPRTDERPSRPDDEARKPGQPSKPDQP